MSSPLKTVFISFTKEWGGVVIKCCLSVCHSFLMDVSSTLWRKPLDGFPPNLADGQKEELYCNYVAFLETFTNIARFTCYVTY